jgi:hypothetical protein
MNPTMIGPVEDMDDVARFALKMRVREDTAIREKMDAEEAAKRAPSPAQVEEQAWNRYRGLYYLTELSRMHHEIAEDRKEAKRQREVEENMRDYLRELGRPMQTMLKEDAEFRRQQKVRQVVEQMKALSDKWERDRQAQRERERDEQRERSRNIFARKFAEAHPAKPKKPVIHR